VAAAQAAWDAATVAAEAKANAAQSDSKDGRLADETKVRKVAHLTMRMIELAYEQPLSEENRAVVAAACPEVGWLVQCAMRAPQPPGWRHVTSRYIDGETGEEKEEIEPRYVCDETGETTDDMPLFQRFARMARLALQARQNRENASAAAAWLRAARDDALKEAMRLQD